MGGIFLAAVAAIALSGMSACRASPPAQDGIAAQSLEFTGFVVDQAKILTPEQRRRLTEQLDRFQQQTGHQLVVVTVAGLGGEEVAAFTTRLANQWGVGRKGVDDGIVLLVAPRERKARIAVGRGLERALPDSFCRTVMDREMVPAFARGRLGEGIAAGVAAISGQLTRPPAA